MPEMAELEVFTQEAREEAQPAQEEKEEALCIFQRIPYQWLEKFWQMARPEPTGAMEPQPAVLEPAAVVVAEADQEEAFTLKERL